ncbi:MAG TPA: carboxypeptidase regulatory-like domain-containing protein [Terriglobales bacterium]|nr:carboxypeptidase regulatory-like domain-containing protein [Terriglobales bacterium]
MTTRKFAPFRAVVLGITVLTASLCYAQFSGGIQGAVQDPSGAMVQNASVQLQNNGTQVTREAKTDADGNFRFVSLEPGAYKVTVSAGGYTSSEVNITLLTEQTLNVPVTLKLGAVSESVTVTTEAPVIDTADSRTQLTLENQAVAQLPLQGRNLVTLVTLAPGVSGLGTTGSGNGTPGSGPDNFSTEEAIDASANGQGSDNNQYVIDGLDVTSGIRQGVLNLTPTPDSIQETSIQVNTFSSEHSRAAGVLTAFTTRSGTDQFHGSAADYFNYQGMFAHQHFAGIPYKPFHSNDFSFAVGGPVIKRHLFFYFAAEPRRGSNGAGGNITFAAPEFLNFIKATPALAGTVGTHILTTYLPVGLSGVGINQTAQQILGTSANGCNTAATNFIPCALPMTDIGAFGATAIRNGTQYFGRLDTDFKNDRVYVSLYRTTLTSGAPSASPQFSSLNPTWEVAGQATWTHTFSPTTLNDASAGQSRVEGQLATGAKDYTVPNINAGISQQLGAGFAQGDFIQHNYHWRDVLTHIQGAHTLKFGYEGWYGDDVENFQGPWATPTFGFNNILKLAQDAPNNENGVFYNPATGTQQLANWDAAARTFGLFVEDTWKAKRNLTLTLGLRYDDSGNPWSKNASTVFGNFYLGTGTTQQQQVANGYAKGTHNALLHSVNDLFSPRAGFAWDPTGNGDWVVRGGFGIYQNWLTSANVQEEFRGSPPGEVAPNFVAGGTATAQAPIFLQGNSSKPPFGFTFPTFVGGLNSQGGVVGASFGIGGINPLLKSPVADVWSLGVEKKILSNFAASVGYSGSHSYNIVGNGDVTNGVSYGVNINAFPNDLIINESTQPTRLNHSFGSISYALNDRHGNYEGVYVDFKGHFSRGYFDASYTHSQSRDDGGGYPTAFDPQTYYGPSPWDVPNRFSFSFNYSLKGLKGGVGPLGVLTGGWGISGASIFQSGEPFTVRNSNSYQPVCANAGACPSVSNPAIGYGPSSGDYNADGVNFDYLNAVAYTENTSRSAFLNGAIPKSDFTVPTFGSGLTGNEKTGQFRQPNFAETDANFYKDTRITERVNFELRFEFFNLFNRANLINIDSNFPDGNFGKATGSHLPRYWQVGGKISF